MRYALILAALMLAGCASTGNRALENRLACSADKTEAYVISKWWRVAIASLLSPSDTAIVCR